MTEVLTSRKLEGAGFLHGFGTRHGEKPRDVHFGRQVHGALVWTLTSGGVAPTDGCDGLVASQPGDGVGVVTADCVPLLLADRVVGLEIALNTPSPPGFDLWVASASEHGDVVATVEQLLGDRAKAKRQLNWEPQVKFEELVQIMTDGDLRLLDNPAYEIGF